MTVVTRTSAKAYFETGDKPTQAQFGDLIDSAMFSEDFSNFGKVFVSAATTASGQNQLGIGAVGRTIFEAATTASAQNNLGGGAVGKNLFEATTTASALSQISGGTVGIQMFTATTTASAQSLINNSPTFINPTLGAAKATTLILNGGNSLDLFSGAGLAAGIEALDLGTSASTNGLQLLSGTTSFVPAVIGRNNSTTGTYVQFVYNNTAEGSISTNGSVTAYNTSSDYRLKDKIKDYEKSALKTLASVKVRTFVWKADPDSKSDIGCIAHELQEFIPGAVTGEKDATFIGKDNVERILPQQVDYSKIVPYLIKAIQELKAEVESLK